MKTWPIKFSRHFADRLSRIYAIYEQQGAGKLDVSIEGEFRTCRNYGVMSFSFVIRETGK